MTENTAKTEINWTEEQLAAINTTDRGVVVSAAAGSGKTAVLIERIIRLLSDPDKNITPDRLLAVTFTVDAAAQMKEKLTKELNKKLLGETDPIIRAYLQKQQDRLPMAKISTINSFCLDLVKSNIHEFEFQDGIKILDENDADIILDGAVGAAMDRLAEESAEELDLLVDTLSDNDETTIEKAVRELCIFLRSLPFPDEWINKRLGEFADEKKIDEYVRIVADEYRSKLERALKLNEIARAQLERLGSRYKMGNGAFAALDSDMDILNELTGILKNGEWESIYRAFNGISWNTLRFAPEPKDAGLDYRSGVDSIKDRRKEYKKIVDGIKSSVNSIGDRIAEDMEKSGKIFSLLCRLWKYTEEASMEEKLLRNSLEFSDVERMAIRLLVGSDGGKLVRTPLAEEIVANQDHKVILIDEFQDVNNLQELIFKALSDTDDLSHMGKNVFVVGDVKQSIYRFRQSNPQLFINAKKFSASEDHSGGSRLVELTNNYRSRRSVVDFVNDVFRNIMSEEVGELVYGDGEKLRYGADYKEEDKDTEIMVIYPQEEKDGGEDNEEDYSIENLAIARRIREIIDSGEKVFDTKSKKSRLCRPSDFCVLSRSRTSTVHMAAALETVGLKAVTEDNKGYLRSREITVMTDLLKVIDNPMQDISLAAVMMSPILGFTADDVAVIRRKCVTEDGYLNHIFQVVNSVAKTESETHKKEAKKITLGNERLEEKCREAYTLIQNLRFYAAGMTLPRLIRKIYDDTGFFAVASGYENSRQKRANLRMLLEYAAAYENAGNGGISGFLRYLRSLSERGKDFDQAVTVTKGEDSVVIKTIHASKGLEFPFVFLCGITKRFNLRDMSASMLLDEYAGVGFCLLEHDRLTKTETISHSALSIISRSKMLSEELRLLYVALTRAKERLFIPICIKNSKRAHLDISKTAQSIALDISNAGGVNGNIIRRGNSYFDWLTAALMCSEDFGYMRECFEIDVALPKGDHTAKITYSTFEDVRNALDDAPDIYHGKYDEKAASGLRKIYETPINSAAADTPSKLTVTELVKERREREYGEKNPEFYPQLPRLSAELGKLSAAQRGTYTHLFMELANYDNAERDAAAELDRLKSGGYFTEKEAGGVYIGAVRSFFAGDFYKRMKKSGEIIRERQFLVSFSDLGLEEDDEFAAYCQNGSMLQGIADCIFREEDGYVLVDYKTDNFEDLSQPEKYAVQLKLYKAALDKLLDMPIKACYIYSFRLGEGIEIALDTH